MVVGVESDGEGKRRAYKSMARRSRIRTYPREREKTEIRRKRGEIEAEREERSRGASNAAGYVEICMRRMQPRYRALSRTTKFPWHVIASRAIASSVNATYIKYLGAYFSFSVKCVHVNSSWLDCFKIICTLERTEIEITR